MFCRRRSTVFSLMTCVGAISLFRGTLQLHEQHLLTRRQASLSARLLKPTVAERRGRHAPGRPGPRSRRGRTGFRHTGEQDPNRIESAFFGLIEKTVNLELDPLSPPKASDDFFVVPSLFVCTNGSLVPRALGVTNRPLRQDDGVALFGKLGS